MGKDIKQPRKSTGDYIHTLIKATAGSIPIVGNFASELFLNLVISPYEKRQEQWISEVTSMLTDLNMKHSFNTDSLHHNHEFLDAVISTTKSALATRSLEKRKQLLIALQNIALGTNNDEITNKIFLNLLDKFDDAHMHIITILNTPNIFREPRGEFAVKESYRKLIIKKLPNAEREAIDILTKELLDNKLITMDLPAGLDSVPDIGQEGRSFLTPFGQKFLLFITNSQK